MVTTSAAVATRRLPRGYRLSWPLAALVGAAYAALFLVGVTVPAAWLVVFIVTPSVIAPV